MPRTEDGKGEQDPWGACRQGHEGRTEDNIPWGRWPTGEWDQPDISNSDANPMLYPSKFFGLSLAYVAGLSNLSPIETQLGRFIWAGGMKSFDITDFNLQFSLSLACFSGLPKWMPFILWQENPPPIPTVSQRTLILNLMKFSNKFAWSKFVTAASIILSKDNQR